MPRPKVIQELSSYLAGLFRAGLRSGERGEALFPVYWGHPRDFDEHPELSSATPLVGLCLLDVRPEPRVRAGAALVEGHATMAAERQLEVRVLRQPLWVNCRYLLSIRSDDPLEEQELVAAALQLLHDHPLVPIESFESLRESQWLRAAGESFPIRWVSGAGDAGAPALKRHRILVAFEATVPVPSTRQESRSGVGEREFRMHRLGETARTAGTPEEGR
jgi:hypothetical protein